jgi:hypothetical protein
MATDGHLLLILHELPTEHSAARSLRLFWRAPDGTWQSDCLGGGIVALQTHLTEYATAVEELDRLEDGATRSEDFFRVRHAISPIRRASHNLHKALQDGREAAPEDRQLISCRNQADSIERAADLVYEDAEHGLQYAIAKQGEHQAAATHRLNVLAALFLPLATIAAVFGMNLPHGFERINQPWPFILVLMIGIAMGLVVKTCVVPKPPRIQRDRYAVRPLAK